MITCLRRKSSHWVILFHKMEIMKNLRYGILRLILFRIMEEALQRSTWAFSRSFRITMYLDLARKITWTKELLIKVMEWLGVQWAGFKLTIEALVTPIITKMEVLFSLKAKMNQCLKSGISSGMEDLTQLKMLFLGKKRILKKVLTQVI